MRNAGKGPPPPLPKRGRPATSPEGVDERLTRRATVEPLSLLHTPTPKEHEKIVKRDSRRLTLVSKAFACQCILAGCSDKQINLLLRHRGYILPGEADLSWHTLARVRGLPEAALDADLLTLEARQVGHNILSSWIVRWAELGDSAFDALEAMYKSEEPMAFCSPAACISLAFHATKLILDTFGMGLPERLQAELEANLTSLTPPEGAAGAVTLPPKEKILGHLEAIMARAYESAGLTAESMDAGTSREAAGLSGQGPEDPAGSR